jgi:hypothetical protein
LSRYQPLADFLASQKSNEWTATFADIEERLGFRLPASAYKYPAWWANQSNAGHSQTRGWRSVGWRTTALDLASKRVRFEREREGVTLPTSKDTAEDIENMLRQAREWTGIEDRDSLIREALKALLAREAAARLARLGGTMPDFKAPPRRRPTA